MMNQQADQSALTMGVQLRAARERQGLSQKDVARQLRLPLTVIAALEEDRTQQIPMVYLKGYLRSYARFLELDEQQLCTGMADQQKVPELRLALPHGRNYSWLEHTGKVAGYLVVTAFVVAPLVWWFTQGAVRLSFDESLVSSQQPVATSQSDRQPGQIDNQAGNTDTPDNNHLQASAAPFPSLRSSGNNDQPPILDTVAAESLLSEPEQPDNLVEAVASADDSAQQDQPQTEPVAEVLPDSGFDQLRIQMLNDSWVEITAADGERLEYDLLSTGRIKSYSGKAPFKLLFGRASAVELFLNNDLIDLSPYTRGNVASTTLASNREPLQQPLEEPANGE